MAKLIRPDGTSITSVGNWTRPKKEELHWQDGRSAKELAKAWFRPPPMETTLIALLGTVFPTVVLDEGAPEKVTSLPERGEGRNHDLWLKGKTGINNITVCIEAKADEPFGEIIKDHRNKALSSENSTRLPKRISSLLQILGISNNSWDDLRYQLLTAITGTILQAKKDNSNTAVFIVWEFRSDKTDASKRAKNNDDLENLLLKLSHGTQQKIITNKLYGPFLLNSIELYVGKVSEEV